MWGSELLYTFAVTQVILTGAGDGWLGCLLSYLEANEMFLESGAKAPNLNHCLE